MTTNAPVERFAARARTTALCDTAHILALAVWLGALMTGVISAANLFPAMRQLNPSLPGFEAFGGEHWKLGAGRIQAGVFLVTDFIQLGAAGLAFLTLGLRLIGAGVERSARRPATVVGALGVGAAVVLLTTNLMLLSPRMMPHLKTYWALAREGRTEEALAESAEFAAMHPTASRVLGGIGAGVCVALGAGVWSLARKPER